MSVTEIIKDEDPKTIEREFKQFAEDVFGAKQFKKEAPLQYSMYIPGEMKRAEFEEGMNEFCKDHNLNYELIDQAPEAPSRQYFSENLKLLYPDVKSYEVLEKNKRKLERAKELFKAQWNQEFDPEDEDDKEDIVLLYNEYIEELREWKIVEVKLSMKGEKEDEN